ncbi:MAG: hypothetical protein SH857_05035 [Chitinophagales bacterium]|nr:hypothetical protein [Chitinophagales bacterium]
MKKYILIIAITLAGINVHAQEKGSGMLQLNYHMAMPTSDFKDFLDEPSFRGFSADYRYYAADKFAVGLQSGYHVFSHKYPRDTYYFDNGAATLVQWRYVHVVPIIAVAHYDLLAEDSKLQVSAGLGMGAYYVREEAWIGLYTLTAEQWGFGLAPEVMLRYNFNDRFGMLFSPRYEVVFGGERANLADEKNNLAYWDFRFGAYFKL